MPIRAFSAVSTHLNHCKLLNRLIVCGLFAAILMTSRLSEASIGRLNRYEYARAAMGVRARIVVYAPDRRTAELACQRAFDRLAELEDVMSDYRPSSELMRLCAKAGGPPVKVSKDLLMVLLRAREVSKISNGAFDVTVGPLVRLWREARKTLRLPDPSKLQSSLKLVGWQKMCIDPKRSTVRLKFPGMLLDLGGIAKGYACDEALKVLKRCRISRALVEMGGDIALGDPPPGKRGWLIEIPCAPTDLRRQELSNCGVSTSGDAEQFVEIDGQRYSHIVDPRTGLGVTDRIEVTIIASDCTTSDSLATAISVLGTQKDTELLKRCYPKARIFMRKATDGG